MENPSKNEEYMVVSGKHTFLSQKNAVVRKLHDLRLLSAHDLTNNVSKPQLVNLVPNNIPGRVDLSRRNINIR